MHSQFRKLTNLKRVNPWEIFLKRRLHKLNLVQVHISNIVQCLGKHKLFKLTNGQSTTVIS